MSDKTVNVLITRPLEIWKHIDRESLSQIEAVSDRVRVIDISDLTYAERHGDFSSKEKLDTLLAEAGLPTIPTCARGCHKYRDRQTSPLTGNTRWS